jgi:hypothetical protein
MGNRHHARAGTSTGHHIPCNTTHACTAVYVDGWTLRRGHSAILCSATARLLDTSVLLLSLLPLFLSPSPSLPPPLSPRDRKAGTADDDQET